MTSQASPRGFRRCGNGNSTRHMAFRFSLPMATIRRSMGSKTSGSADAASAGRDPERRHLRQVRVRRMIAEQGGAIGGQHPLCRLQILDPKGQAIGRMRTADRRAGLSSTAMTGRRTRDVARCHPVSSPRGAALHRSRLSPRVQIATARGAGIMTFAAQSVAKRNEVAIRPHRIRAKDIAAAGPCCLFASRWPSRKKHRAEDSTSSIFSGRTTI